MRRLTLHDRELVTWFSEVGSLRTDAVLRSLPYREARCIVLRLGLGGERPYTFEELAPLFGVGHNRVRSIFMRAASKAWRSGRDRPLRAQCDPYRADTLLLMKYVPLNAARFCKFFAGLKMTCSSFATAANVSTGAVHRWLHPGKGGVRHASPDNVCRLAYLMGVDAVDLLKGATVLEKQLVRETQEAGLYKKGLIRVTVEPRTELLAAFKEFELRTGWRVRNPEGVFLEPVREVGKK